jgi:hypothetical protein
MSWQQMLTRAIYGYKLAPTSLDYTFRSIPVDMEMVEGFWSSLYPHECADDTMSPDAAMVSVL